MTKKKKNKKNLQKNGNQRHKEHIVVEGEAYQRLYDENGNLINSTYFDRDNFIVSWVDYTYDVYKVKSG